MPKPGTYSDEGSAYAVSRQATPKPASLADRSDGEDSGEMVAASMKGEPPTPAGRSAEGDSSWEVIKWGKDDKDTDSCHSSPARIAANLEKSSYGIVTTSKSGDDLLIDFDAPDTPLLIHESDLSEIKAPAHSTLIDFSETYDSLHTPIATPVKKALPGLHRKESTDIFNTSSFQNALALGELAKIFEHGPFVPKMDVDSPVVTIKQQTVALPSTPTAVTPAPTSTIAEAESSAEQ